MKYAKLKVGFHYFKVDDNFVGISVFLNGEHVAISTYSGGKSWFGKMYEAIKEEEFNNAYEAAKKIIEKV